MRVSARKRALPCGSTRAEPPGEAGTGALEQGRFQQAPEIHWSAIRKYSVAICNSWRICLVFQNYPDATLILFFFFFFFINLAALLT